MDTNRLIKIEELEVGDEILVASGSSLRYYRVLRKPRKNPKTNKWAGVRCSTCIEEKQITRGAGQSWAYTFVKTTYFCTPDDHNCEKNIYGLNYRTMWLVNRGGMS